MEQLTDAKAEQLQLYAKHIMETFTVTEILTLVKLLQFRMEAADSRTKGAMLKVIKTKVKIP